jgi:hypothetical protein
MATLNIKGFPDGLYKILQQRAESDRCSLDQKVISLLQIAVEEPNKPAILELKGLGKKSWEGVNATKHINLERGSYK